MREGQEYLPGQPPEVTADMAAIAVDTLFRGRFQDALQPEAYEELCSSLRAIATQSEGDLFLQLFLVKDKNELLNPERLKWIAIRQLCASGR